MAQNLSRFTFHASRLAHYAAGFRPRASRLLLLFILLAAAGLRLTGLDWDQYSYAHPDERYVALIAATVTWPASWSAAFDPRQSSFNPYYWPPDADSPGIIVEQDQPRFFAYGHLPLYIGAAAAGMMAWLGPRLHPYLPAGWPLTRDLLNGGEWLPLRHLTAVARAVTALVDVASVLLVYLLGKQLYSRPVGLLAAAFLSVAVLHIQLARFFAVDPYLTFFGLVALYGLARSVRGEKGFFWLGAVGVGLAVGSKFAGALLLLPLLAAAWWTTRDEPWSDRLAQPVAGAAVAFLAFALTNPFALLDNTCTEPLHPMPAGPFTLELPETGSCWLENINRQASMVGGEREPVFVRQYIDTAPYLYFVEMQLRWGLGPLLGLAALAGLGLVIQDGRVWLRGRREERPALFARFIVWLWLLPFLLLTGNFFVKFMRYLQPAIPLLLIFAAALLWQIPSRRWRAIAVLVALLPTTLYALAFVNQYRQPHPWVEASRWIYETAPAGAFVAAELWDDPLPVSLTLDGERLRRTRYRTAELSWIAGADQQDSPAKLEANLALLAEADYVTIASNRIYGVVPRLPDRYPLSSQYHQLLFDGELGYELVYVGGRFPHLWGFHLKHDTFSWPALRPPAEAAAYLESLPGLNWGRADESFIVYDQPLVMIFANRERLPAAEMIRLFELD